MHLASRGCAGRLGVTVSPCQAGTSHRPTGALAAGLRSVGRHRLPQQRAGGSGGLGAMLMGVRLLPPPLPGANSYPATSRKTPTADPAPQSWCARTRPTMATTRTAGQASPNCTRSCSERCAGGRARIRIRNNPKPCAPPSARAQSTTQASGHTHVPVPYCRPTGAPTALHPPARLKPHCACRSMSGAAARPSCLTKSTS